MTKPSERLGALLYRLSPIPLSDRQRRALRLQDKPIAEFYADKAVMMIIGAVLPGLAAFVWTLTGSSVGSWPALLSLAGAVIGFFVPDLLLRRAADTARSGRSRPCSSSSTWSPWSAWPTRRPPRRCTARPSSATAPLFLQIRTALERARLEQQPPYDELRRVADQLHLPELADVADVMQLDETGAALSGALRARVRELRDAHLTSEQTKASAAAEGMTIYMTLPALIFSLIFLVAAMLTIFFPEAS